MSRIMPVALLVVALAGCSGTVEGQAVKPSAAPGSDVGARTISQVLPDIAELSKTLGSPMQVGYPDGTVGGVDDLSSGFADASPTECVGVPAVQMRQTYQGVPVRATTAIQWRTTAPAGAFPRPDLEVNVGVVELDSPASAHTVYDYATANWRHCQNVPVVVHKVAGNDLTFTFTMNRVDATDGALTSIVMLTTSTDNRASPYQRAFLAASRYTVDVEVSDAAWTTGSPVNADSAVTVARLIADRIISTS